MINELVPNEESMYRIQKYIKYEPYRQYFLLDKENKLAYIIRSINEKGNKRILLIPLTSWTIEEIDEAKIEEFINDKRYTLLEINEEQDSNKEKNNYDIYEMLLYKGYLGKEN